MEDGEDCDGLLFLWEFIPQSWRKALSPALMNFTLIVEGFIDPEEQGC